MLFITVNKDRIIIRFHWLSSRSKIFIYLKFLRHLNTKLCWANHLQLISKILVVILVLIPNIDPIYFHPNHLPSQQFHFSYLWNGENHACQLFHKDIVRINELMLGKHVSALDECCYINANDCITARLTCKTAMNFRS